MFLGTLTPRPIAFSTYVHTNAKTETELIVHELMLHSHGFLEDMTNCQKVLNHAT